MNKRWVSVAGLLVLFGVLALFYALNTPLFEAPDEPWHYAYVRWLAEGHGLPRLDDNASGANQEVAQPPLYYAVAAFVTAPVADDDLPDLLWHNPYFGYQAGGTVNEDKNMLIHTDREDWPWRGAVLAVRLARLVSLTFGLLAVGATYGLAREALPAHPSLALAATGLVALTPQFLFISGVVSNDSATAAVCTAALWALVRIARRGPTPRRSVVAGLLLGLALLSKTSALILLPLAVAAAELGRRTTDRPPGRLQTYLPLLGLALTLGGWWYGRNALLFGDPLGLSVHTHTPWGRETHASLPALLPELPQVWRSFWGAFGWGHVEMPGWVYWALGGLVGAALAGWVRQLRRSPLVSWATLFLTGGWCLTVLGALLRWMQQVEAPHGRLLFPALGAWALLLTVGWAGLHRAWPVVALTFLALLALVVPWAVIRPAFARPALLLPQEAARRVVSFPLDYGGQARLLGYRVEPALHPPRLRAASQAGLGTTTVGEGVQVTFCWQALRPMTQDYALFIHLLGPENARVAERITYPGQGRFPTSLWPVGRAFCDTYRLPVASWAPAPALYALEVGLYDAETGERLVAYDADGQPLELPTVGMVRVAPQSSPRPPAHLLAYELGDEITLLGYDAQLESGDTLALTLYWEALKAPAGDYKVFVHLLDGAGELVTQDDTPPRSGQYPTWAWQPGDLVPDLHRLSLPVEKTAGPYRLLVGMYRPETPDLERLPVTGPDGPLADRAISLEALPWP